MAKQVKSCSLPVALESLEARTLLSGNVLARVVHGDLVIRGDRSDNNVLIAAGANSGEVVVSAGNITTRINGWVAPVTLTGVTGSVRVRMRGGEDSVDLSGLTVAKNLKVDLGWFTDPLDGDSHADSLFVTNTTVGGNVLVTSGRGNGDITLGDMTVAGSVTVAGRGRASSVDLDKVAVGKSLTVRSRGGGASVSNSTINGATAFFGTGVEFSSCTLNGNLMVNAVRFYGEMDPSNTSDREVDIMGTTVAKAVRIATGRGRDFVYLSNSTFGDSVRVATGRGADTALIDGSTFNERFSLDTRGGNDEIYVSTGQNTTFAEEATFRGGAGDDTLTVGSITPRRMATFQGEVLFSGGAGSDTLIYLTNGNSFLSLPTTNRFEMIV